MAIMINKDVTQYVLNHKISKVKNGMSFKNKRLMGLSLSINYHNMLLINAYAPAKGKKINEVWMAKCLIPIISQCWAAGWLNIIGAT